MAEKRENAYEAGFFWGGWGGFSSSVASVIQALCGCILSGCQHLVMHSLVRTVYRSDSNRPKHQDTLWWPRPSNTSMYCGSVTWTTRKALRARTPPPSRSFPHILWLTARTYIICVCVCVSISWKFHSDLFTTFEFFYLFIFLWKVYSHSSSHRKG